MDTREQIIEVAQGLAQRRGFNAFSYADISEAIGIRKASIHHHFPTKQDLELEMVARYRDSFQNALEEISITHTSSIAQLRAYGALYAATLQSGKICLCGMMATDLMALPEAMRIPLAGFFSDQLEWLSNVLDVGRRCGEIAFRGGVEQRAKTLLACFQGGLIIARSRDDTQFFQTLMDDQIASVAQ